MDDLVAQVLKTLEEEKFLENTFVLLSSDNGYHLGKLLLFILRPFTLKLNPLRAMWPMERALISDFCSVKRMRVFDSPWTGH